MKKQKTVKCKKSLCAKEKYRIKEIQIQEDSTDIQIIKERQYGPFIEVNINEL